MPTEHGVDLQEGTMYAQGIATIALCEAYGMTQDESLRQPAQRAIDFICWAQHSAGGWRYYPSQPGDTTVFWLADDGAQERRDGRTGCPVARRDAGRTVSRQRAKRGRGVLWIRNARPRVPAPPRSVC